MANASYLIADYSVFQGSPPGSVTMCTEYLDMTTWAVAPFAWYLRALLPGGVPKGQLH
jgi:hypothetical protein